MWRALLFIGLMLIHPAVAAQPLGLSADAAYRRAQSGELILIDIRSPREWRQTGVPAGASAVSMHNPQGVEAFYEAVLTAVKGNKDRPIAVICAAGVRSRWAQRYLTGKGFARVENVAEGVLGNGVLPGWLKRGLPVTPY